MVKTSQQIATAFQKLAVFWRSSQWQAAKEIGLNPTQGEVLLRISRRPERLADLATMFGISQASLSDTVSSLETKGLAIRRKDPDDGRVRRIEATPDGRLLAADVPEAPAVLEHVIENMSETERGALARSLVRIIRALQEAEAIPVQRMCVTCRHFRPYAHSEAARPHHCEFVNAAFGDASLRLDCDDHDAAPADEAVAMWRRFETT